MARLDDLPGQRSLRIAVGLALYGMSQAVLVKARLGTDPWTVFTQGLTRVTGFTLGQTSVGVSLVLLALWAPLRQRPGL
jgi:uncharacterized membrane protein YczE